MSLRTSPRYMLDVSAEWRTALKGAHRMPGADQLFDGMAPISPTRR